MSHHYISWVDRRTTLKWLAAAASVATLPALATGATWKINDPGGYGSDPDIMNPTIPWQKMMTARQLEITAKMCDIILPDDGKSPSASAIGIPDFIDEWVSAPYPDQQKDKVIILNGLRWLDDHAKSIFHSDYLALKDEDRLAICRNISGPTADKVPATFFQRLRHLTVEAYYSTETGLKDIGYMGNVPLEEFPGPSPEILNILEIEMKKLGL
ncbi:MAG: Tat pathway signal protein [Alphaproteobacteria bacterium]|nr:MAG: Tat pathway signal protein [Alphaproteobacteria bacterium]